mmetsp:Transcript_77085/g.216283  ORF Transcript_77085/g.216283 Transcript_77085/m.216283 type:complete len:232 (-) Transcript_77085:367-1062(-)
MALLRWRTFSCSGAQALARMTATDVISNLSSAAITLSSTSLRAKIVFKSRQKPCASSSAMLIAFALADATCCSQAATTLCPWLTIGWATASTRASCRSQAASVDSRIPDARSESSSFVGAGSWAWISCSAAAMSEAMFRRRSLLLTLSTSALNFSFRKPDRCASRLPLSCSWPAGSLSGQSPSGCSVARSVLCLLAPLLPDATASNGLRRRYKVITKATSSKSSTGTTTQK